LSRSRSLRDGDFDRWLVRALEAFAAQNRTAMETPLPGSLSFGPVRTLEYDEPWQRGALAWEGEAFDVTPLRARLWAAELSDEDARDALRRRRLANVPLARWLSAWASSIEESLRVIVLRVGSQQFQHFLERQPPRQPRGAFLRSRLEELGPEGEGGAVDRADFGDLAAFVAQHHPRPSLKSSAQLLEQCRLARNRVVHQRLVFTSDLLHITNTAYWLNEIFA
jgi:hypothetical protein